MTDLDGLSDLPADPAPLAFVLRLKSYGTADAKRQVIVIDDVQTLQCWRFTSLDDAFAQIRTAISHHTGAGTPTGKPN